MELKRLQMENCLLEKSLEEIKTHYRKDLNLGGWFSFNSTKTEWQNFYAEKMLNHFFSSEMIDKAFKGFTISPELLITNNISFLGLKNKSVLIVGGGPSTSLLTKDQISKYDYIVSCNHFFKNPTLKETRIDLCLIGDEVNLQSKEFLDYIETFKPAIGFEHSARRTDQDLIKFRKNYPKCFVYLTRYFSRLGFVARAIIICALAKPNKIDYIGMDGHKKGSYAHAFQPGKPAPVFNEEQKYKEQVEIFFKYLFKDVNLHKDSICDLGKSHSDNLYHSILEKVKKT